jgi:hypothetical protein
LADDARFQSAEQPRKVAFPYQMFLLCGAGLCCPARPWRIHAALPRERHRDLRCRYPAISMCFVADADYFFDSLDQFY